MDWDLDSICDDFEERWKSGERPDIAESLARVGDAQRFELLRELIEIELWWRRKETPAPSEDEYQAHFPEDHSIVAEAFEAFRQRSVAEEKKSQTQDVAETVIEHASNDPAEQPTLLPGTDQNTPASGDRVKYFGEYELLEEIARGGMGVVFKARQVKLNRIVALKMILSGELAGEEEVQRFKTEAEAAANLDHPGIVSIYEIGEHNGQHYFSMGFVEGQSLADRVKDGPLPPREAAEIVKKVAEAVAYAHDKGVIHRDLKPANVLLDVNGEPRVTDFGLAKQVESDSDLTQTGAVMGTPSYMPPEQAGGKTEEVGPRADVYALGAILYCLLTSRPPFQSANPMDILLQVLEKEPVSAESLNPNIPSDLNTICQKCLQKDVARRYQSATVLADELGRFLKGEPITARPISRLERGWRWCRRNPFIAASGLTAVIAVIVTIVGLSVARDQAIDAQKRTERTLNTVRLIEAARATATSPTKSRSTLDRIPNEHRNLAWHLLSRSANLYHHVTYCPHPVRQGRRRPFHRYWVAPSGSHAVLGDNDEIWLCSLDSKAPPLKLLDREQLKEMVTLPNQRFFHSLRFNSLNSLVVQVNDDLESALAYNIAKKTWKTESVDDSDSLAERNAASRSGELVPDLLTVNGNKLQLVCRRKLPDGRYVELRVPGPTIQKTNTTDGKSYFGGSRGKHTICVHKASAKEGVSDTDFTAFAIPGLTRLDQYAEMTLCANGRQVILHDTSNALSIDPSDGATRNLTRELRGKVWQVAVAQNGRRIAFIHHRKDGRDIQRVQVTIMTHDGRMEFESSYESPNVKIKSKSGSGAKTQVQWSTSSFGRMIDHASFSTDGSTFCFIENDRTNDRSAIHRVTVDAEGIGPTWRAHERRIASAVAFPSGDLTTVDIGGTVRNWRDGTLHSEWTIPEASGATTIAVRDRCILVLSWKAASKFSLTHGDWSSVFAQFTGRAFDRQSGKQLISLPETVIADAKSGSAKKAMQLSQSELSRLPVLSPDGRFLAQLLETDGKLHIRCIIVKTGNVAFETPSDKLMRLGFSDDGQELLTLRQIGPWKCSLGRFASRDGNSLREVHLDTPTMVIKEFQKIIPKDIEPLKQRMEEAVTEMNESSLSDIEKVKRISEQFSMSELMKIRQLDQMKAQLQSFWPMSSLVDAVASTDPTKHNWRDFFNRTGRMKLETLDELPLILQLDDGRYFDFRHRTNTIRLHEDDGETFPVIREFPMAESLKHVWANLADNDRILLTIGPDLLLKLWSVETADLTGSFKLPFAETRGFSASTDGSRLVMWGDDGRVVVYRLTRE